jgi:deoxyinosine 3'endonuclease (endonuclease V)
MRIRQLHPWKVSTAEARALQLALRERMERRDRLPEICVVAGADAAFVEPENRSWERGTGRAIAAVVTYRFPKMEALEQVTAN